MFRILKSFEEIQSELPGNKKRLFTEHHYNALCRGLSIVLEFKNSDIQKLTILKKSEAESLVLHQGFGAIIDSDVLWKKVDTAPAKIIHEVPIKVNQELQVQKVQEREYKLSFLSSPEPVKQNVIIETDQRSIYQPENERIFIGLNDNSMPPERVGEYDRDDASIINTRLLSFYQEDENIFNRKQDYFITRIHDNPKYDLLNLNNSRLII